MSKNSNVVTRFAPSPTGYLHIGGARTALYSYLIAKQYGGKFILRIEDTDLERSTDEAIQAILDGMKWLGLDHDEGPYFQTKRFDLYNEYVDKLVQDNKAYPCFCTEAELSMKREKAQNIKIKYKYDRTCYHLPTSERAQRLAEGRPHCVRFYSTDEGTIQIKDKIKGDVFVEAKELDDLIIRRTDGAPTYNFTVVVDDALMKVTHVIRGDDHLNNTPRQIQMYEALGFPIPEFAHCSMILGDDKKKLSKRHGATSVMAYRDMGYLPQAILNYLVRLGWAHKDQEIFSMEEMIQLFNLESVNSASAVFNTSKLQWLNGHYIRIAKPEDLLSEVKYLLGLLGVANPDESLLLKAISISQEKVKTLLEMAEFLELFFKDVPTDSDVIAKNINDTNKIYLKRLCQALPKITTPNHDSLHTLFNDLATEFGVGLGKIAGPARAGISGKKISPSVFEMIEIFGVSKVLELIYKNTGIQA